MRSIYDLTTKEAYRLVNEHFGHDLPPLEAVENEDWGRDYVLQRSCRLPNRLIKHSRLNALVGQVLRDQV